MASICIYQQRKEEKCGDGFEDFDFALAVDFNDDEHPNISEDAPDARPHKNAELTNTVVKRRG